MMLLVNRPDVFGSQARTLKTSLYSDGFERLPVTSDLITDANPVK